MDEYASLGIVKSTDDDMVCLITKSPVPAGDLDEKYRFFAQHIYNHIAAAIRRAAWMMLVMKLIYRDVKLTVLKSVMTEDLDMLNGIVIAESADNQQIQSLSDQRV